MKKLLCLFLFLFLLSQEILAQSGMIMVVDPKKNCRVQFPLNTFPLKNLSEFDFFKNVTAEIKGNCENGSANGKCKIRYIIPGVGSLTYEGDITDGMITGNGEFTVLSKNFGYTWKSITNQENSLGRDISPKDGNWTSVVYSGNWLNGKYQGNGKLTAEFPDKTQSIVSGIWDNGVLNGESEVLMASGSKYTGTIKMDNFNGQGTFTYENGDVYTGEFHDGMKHGQGTYLWKNGNSYSGGFISDIIQGKGKYQGADGVFAEGEFSQGRLSGYGFKHTSNGDFTGYFANGKYIGKALPVWFSDTVPSAAGNSSAQLKFSKVTFVNVDLNSKFQFDRNTNSLIFNGQFPPIKKRIDLEDLKISDTNHEIVTIYKIAYSRGGKYYLIVNQDGIKVMDASNDQQIATISYDEEPRYTLQENYTAISGSFSKYAKVECKKINSDSSEYYLSIHLLVDKLPLLYQKKLKADGEVYFTKNDRHLCVIGKSSVDLLNPNTLETEASFNYEKQHPWDKLIYVSDEDNDFVFTYKKFKEERDSEGRSYSQFDCAYLVFYKWEEGKLVHEKDFPDASFTKVERKGINYKEMTNPVPGDERYVQATQDVTYCSEDFSVYKDYIVVHYRKNSRDHLKPFKLFDRKTGKLLFELNIYDSDAFASNDDCSAFVVKQKGSTDLSNFEGRYKAVLYNTRDTVSRNKTSVTLDQVSAKKEYDKFARQPAENSKKNQFYKDVSIMDSMIYVVNSNDGKDFVEWMNAENSDEIKTWDKSNIFVGGIIKNSGKVAYTLRLESCLRFLKTVSALWISNETQKENGPRLSTTMELKPGESRRFLFCTTNVNWGYYSRGSGTGMRYRLNNPPYFLNYRLSDTFSKNDEEAQTALINEFIENNHNLKQRYKGFAEKYLNVKSELSIYCKLGEKDDKIKIRVYDADNRLVEEKTVGKEYASGATSYNLFVHENTAYKVMVSIAGITNSERIFNVPVKTGFSQLYIENNGSYRMEYRRN